jgi:hypothetical protein
VKEPPSPTKARHAEVGAGATTTAGIAVTMGMTGTAVVGADAGVTAGGAEADVVGGSAIGVGKFGANTLGAGGVIDSGTAVAEDDVDSVVLEPSPQAAKALAKIMLKLTEQAEEKLFFEIIFNHFEKINKKITKKTHSIFMLSAIFLDA